MLGNILDQELRFGVGTPQMVSWEKMVKQWKSIEALGFDSVWIADQFIICSKPTWPWFEGWTLLAGLATQTSRIRIGTMVTAIPWHNQAFLARKALTVDYISHGRLELGLGTGVHGDCGHKMTGIEDWSPRERVERFREFVEIVDQLLCNEEVTYQGRYYQLQEAAMNPSPIQKPRPPITILLWDQPCSCTRHATQIRGIPWETSQVHLMKGWKMYNVRIYYLINIVLKLVVIHGQYDALMWYTIRRYMFAIGRFPFTTPLTLLKTL